MVAGSIKRKQSKKGTQALPFPQGYACCLGDPRYCQTGVQAFLWGAFGDTPYLVVAHEKNTYLSEGPKVSGAMCQEVGLETKYVFPLSTVSQ